MSEANSVSQWIDLLKTDDVVAAERLGERYFEKLAGLARRKLQGSRQRVADQEDVAFSAFDSFCRGAQQPRFAQLTDRDDRWRLLVVITVRKAQDWQTHERRQSRGGKVVEESFLVGAADSGMAGIDALAGPEPSPEFAVQVAEDCQRLLGLLDKDVLRLVALWRMEGHTTEEIAAKLGCVPRTVESKLRVIRRLWAHEIVP